MICVCENSFLLLWIHAYIFLGAVKVERIEHWCSIYSFFILHQNEKNNKAVGDEMRGLNGI